MPRDEIDVEALGRLSYDPAKRRFRLRLYVDGMYFETVYWSREEKGKKGWPAWARNRLRERGVYVG